MREEGNFLKTSWPKMAVRKWVDRKNGADEFHSDYRTKGERRREGCSDDGRYAVVPEELSEWLMETNKENERPGFNQIDLPVTIDSVDLRMFVGTWNVGGKSPQDGLNLEEWLKRSPADIYVLGFQEIVPLNAGNVLGPEDSGPAAKWISLIHKALNGQNQLNPKSRVSLSDMLSLKDVDFIENTDRETSLSFRWNSCSSEEGSPSPTKEKHSTTPVRRRSYCMAAGKQMVGLFLCLWVREDLYQHISRLNVSCVGTGIMGCLGNKGSISISMALHQTTFCFVCTHLASGEKEGDAIRRNSDVTEILKRTRFSNPYRILENHIPPINILDHDKIIWLGDLNYRLASICGDTYKLLERKDWQALLERDQLRIEQKCGRVFKDWEEGEIAFAPTYKYLPNSDQYVAQTCTSKEKRRTPAWCDRILWKGKGLKQISYVRGESRFSDHRPVNSLFSVQVSLPTKLLKSLLHINSTYKENL